MVTSMSKGIKELSAYWLRSNPKRILWIMFAMAFSLFNGLIVVDLLAVLLISTTTIDVFNELTYSLPFSKRQIWRFHLFIEAVLFAIYLAIKVYENIDNKFMILLEIFFVLFAYCSCMKLPEKIGCWWIGIIPMMLAATVQFASALSIRIRMDVNVICRSNTILWLFVILDVLMLFINIYTLKERMSERKLANT